MGHTSRKSKADVKQNRGFKPAVIGPHRYSLVLHKMENNSNRDSGERGRGKQFRETEVPGVLGT